MPTSEDTLLIGEQTPLNNPQSEPGSAYKRNSKQNLQSLKRLLLEQHMPITFKNIYSLHAPLTPNPLFFPSQPPVNATHPLQKLKQALPTNTLPNHHEAINILIIRQATPVENLFHSRSQALLTRQRRQPNTYASTTLVDVLCGLLWDHFGGCAMEGLVWAVVLKSQVLKI